MILVVEKVNGATIEVALDAARGDGIGVEIAPDVFEPLPVARLTGLELMQHRENPTLMASMGRFMCPYPLNPSSRIHVGWSDPDAGLMQPHQRSADFIVSELKSVSLDGDRAVVTTSAPVARAKRRRRGKAV